MVHDVNADSPATDLTRPAALPMMGAQADSHPPLCVEPRYLREEGRLAMIVGDTAGATQALRHFLVLRDRPDPGPMSDDVRWVRTRLSGLNR